MKSSKRASEWPATARKLRPRNSWNYYRSVLNGERYTRSPVNNSAVRPSLRSQSTPTPQNLNFGASLGRQSPRQISKLAREGEKDAARWLCPCKRRPRHAANRGFHDGAVGRIARGFSELTVDGGPRVRIRLPPAARWYGAGGEEMAPSSLHLTDGVP